MDDSSNDADRARPSSPTGANWALGLGIGVAIGSGLALSLDDWGVGIGIGMAIGVVFALSFGSANRKRGAGDSGGADDSEGDAD